MENFETWLSQTPKAELHLHIDGSLQPLRLLKLAKKHNVELPYKTEEEVSKAYDFGNLDEFLALYYLGASALRDEEDFYHLMMDYLQQCRRQNIVHTEIMVEPQTYAANDVPLDHCMNGFRAAIKEARADWDQSVMLILSFLRHLPESEALATLRAADRYREDFVGIGLASSELDFPPEQFVRLYQEAAARGYRLAAHAGEEGPPSYVSDSLTMLGCERIDHGIRSDEDVELMAQLIERQIPLTVCPLSNIKLKCFQRIEDHNILKLLDAGVCVTVNSDDPAYFGGYLDDNFIALETGLGMTRSQTTQLIRNSFAASYLSDAETEKWLGQLA